MPRKVIDSTDSDFTAEEDGFIDARMAEFSDPACSKEARLVIVREVLTAMRDLYDPPLSEAEWKLKKIVSSFIFIIGVHQLNPQTES